MAVRKRTRGSEWLSFRWRRARGDDTAAPPANAGDARQHSRPNPTPAPHSGPCLSLKRNRYDITDQKSIAVKSKGVWRAAQKASSRPSDLGRGQRLGFATALRDGADCVAARKCDTTAAPTVLPLHAWSRQEPRQWC